MHAPLAFDAGAGHVQVDPLATAGDTHEQVLPEVVLGDKHSHIPVVGLGVQLAGQEQTPAAFTVAGRGHVHAPLALSEAGAAQEQVFPDTELGEGH